MTSNPALRQRGQDMKAINYDGTASTARGVVGLAETSAGEASATFAEAGPRAWIDLAGDGQQIEFLDYTDEATGARVLRRVTKRERIGTIFSILKLHMTVEATVVPHIASFSRRDFDPRDFATD